MTHLRFTLRIFLALLTLLLTVQASAFAQVESAQSAPADTAPAEPTIAPLPAPWPADTLFDELSNVGWNYTLYVPAGGSLLTAEQLGVVDVDDPMEYPLIWYPDAAPVALSLVMLGCLDYGTMLDEESFQTIQAEENANIAADFPELLLGPEDVPLTASVFAMVTLADSAENTELTKFSTYDGHYYYSLSFIYPMDADTDTVLSQMLAITDSFGPYFDPEG